jgi:hypothetical protein
VLGVAGAERALRAAAAKTVDDSGRCCCGRRTPIDGRASAASRSATVGLLLLLLPLHEVMLLLRWTLDWRVQQPDGQTVKGSAGVV